MLKWKLLIAACAAVIVLFGACGFEPPPPPPMTLFVGVHTVRVEVKNKTATHQIDPDSLRDALVQAIDAARGKTRLRATIAGDADCVLSVNVLDEDAREVWTDPIKEAALWRFQAKFSVRLTGKDEQLLWSHPGWVSSYPFEFVKIQQQNITPGWNDPRLRKYLSSNWASGLVQLLIYK